MTIQILHFSSPSCSICVNQNRVLEQIKKEISVPFHDKRITTSFAEALTYGVKAAPTLVILRDNKAVKVLPGFQPAERLRDYLNELAG